jgi:DNA-binding MarR family transcriptional regulator
MTASADKIFGLAGFRSALRRFLAASEILCRDEGVTPQQYQALLAIGAWPSPPMTVKDLAGELLLTHHGAVQLLDRLVAAGLVQRRLAETDRRKVEISFSIAGETKLGILAEQHHQELLRRADALRDALDRVRSASA